jgi:hypothetical protein
LAAPLKRNIPTENIVSKNDLIYANRVSNLGINADNFMTKSEALFKRLNGKITIKKIRVTDSQIDRLKSLYTGKQFEKDKDMLLTMYDFIGMNTIHLSVPPIFSGIELFGSPLNTHNEYCSPFEIDKKFGSLGSFWEFFPERDTIYLCNPPFDEIIIRRMANRLIEFLSSSIKLVIIVTIPVWDSKSQKQMKIKDYGLDFEGYTMMKASEYCKEADMLDRYKFPYYDYYQEKKIPASYTHLMILSNFEAKVLIPNIKEKWLRWKGE